MDHAAFNPPPGEAQELEPGIRRILAPNPSPMTFRGTNTYLLGRRRVAVIDPGPDDPAHLAAILGALGPGETVSHILLTHSHVDHSALVPALARATGAPVLAYGDSAAGRDPQIAAIAGLGGGEGIDAGFAPDHCLADGDTVEGDGWSLKAIWTPGHMGNHMCFAAADAVFTGDHVMGWATSMVSPPDGDLTAFMASLEKLQGRHDRVFYPAHGAPVTDPEARLAELIAHRRGREAQILAALDSGPATVAALTARIYTDVAPSLLKAAGRNVLAHLIDLTRRGLAAPQGELRAEAVFTRI
ncbi:MBL fold metallo-hydrolase [Actibacterium sp. MT2.3-13A]|uniref:MBL fold metallo-hydrolase n=1 Tax=Actibacterium sp. MT2.3-13A TaxID=2828332 RepID=UPI001BAD0CD6|nr:MBL fold metallo-hydrolase [Actibacterium sp. MT2.3-13A]